MPSNPPGNDQELMDLMNMREACRFYRLKKECCRRALNRLR